jgi:hypothetical protein
MALKADDWVAKHECDLADRDLVRKCGLSFVLVRSGDVWKMVYLRTGLIVDATDAEIMLWFHCKELFLRLHGQISDEAANRRVGNFG